MGSKENCELLEDELQQLHHSIEQLNSANSRPMPGLLTISESQNNKTSSNKKKRPASNSKDSDNVKDVQTQTPKKAKRRRVATPSAEELVDDPDNPINEILEEIALRKNLTTNNVKHLLRNIIANESVQEMLKCSLNDSTNNKLPFEPKLTRSKTKEWLETQQLPWPPSAKKVTETSVLVNGNDMDSEDSDDDEYRPNEEDTDNHSDEESFLSSHASDLGSPCSSRAPATPLSVPCYQNEDLFKRPLPIETNQEECDLMIGARTRSKLPLNDTPLEHLELAFIPPDISTDMYDSDCDNEEWRKFLKEYVCPPSHQSAENVDDEEADPEYNVLEEEEEVDAEELRADRTVQITKKEVSELLSELFEDELSSSDEESPLEPTEDIQSALRDIAVQLEPTDTAGIRSKSPNKPTGIVQPLPATPLVVRENMAITVSFPTLSTCSPIEVVVQLPEQEQDLDVSSTISPLSVMSVEARCLLEEQLRKHVQLLTQTHLISAQQVELTSVTQECHGMLTDLIPISRNVEIANLEEAINLINYWDTVVEKIPVSDIQTYQQKVVPTSLSGRGKKFSKRSSYHPDRYPFQPKLVQLMAYSRVFIYPNLLPKLAIFQVDQVPCIPSVHEEHTLAMGLEQFAPYCTELLNSSGKKVTKQYHSTFVNSMISHYMLPHWTEKQINYRIQRLTRTHCPYNPVKYYFEHKVAPPLHHAVNLFDRQCTPRLRDVPLSLLPDRWRELMLEHQNNNWLDTISTPRPKIKLQPIAPHPSSPFDLPGPKRAKPRRKVERVRKNSSLPLTSDTTKNKDNNSTILNVSASKSQNPNPANLDAQNAIEGDQLQQNEQRENGHFVTENEPAIVEVSEEADKNQAESVEDEGVGEEEESDVQVFSPVILQAESLEDEDTSEDEESDVAVSSVGGDRSIVESETPLMSSTVVEEQRRTSTDRSSMASVSSQTVKRYILINKTGLDDTTNSNFIHVWGPNLAKPVTMSDKNETQSTSGSGAPVDSKGKETSSMASLRSGKNLTIGAGNSGGGCGSGGDDGEDKRSSPLRPGHSVDDISMTVEDEEEEEELLDQLTATPSSAAHEQSSAPKGRSPAHRQVRHQRNARRILDSWMADDDSAQSRSNAYAQTYFIKVRNRLEQENADAFREFITTLGYFQSSETSTLELYKKIEVILGPHTDLFDEFVLFLSPEAAADCGVQFQHFLYVRMREFFYKLKIHFKDSQSQLKRVLKALQQVESSDSPTVNDLKIAVLPLLKGNAHLTQSFLQLFLDDGPPPSDASDYEEVNMDRVANNTSGDEFEYVQLPEVGPQSKDQRRAATGAKGGNTKNKNKGKSWKKSS